MKTYYITFRSVTYAQRGESILRRAGFRVSLQRTPRWMEEQGCGYALRVFTEEPKPVMNLLRDLPMHRIYRQLGDGVLEELRP